MFEKNLEYIKDEALKRRLSKISIEDAKEGIEYCVTPSNDYVLLKNTLPTDDLNNPREAVKQMLDNNIKNEMKSNDIIITFGIGLGYLLDETFNRYPSKIFVYEPDVNLLRFVLHNVDISEHLASGRVYITNDMDELIEKLSETYITRDKVEVVYLQNYAIVKNKEILSFTQRVFNACKTKMIDINTITKFSQVWLDNTINNLAYINNNTGYLLSAIENKYVGQTALVAGAGPSLKDNIEAIKANREKLTIFAVNKAVKYLVQNGVTPDFVVFLDARNAMSTLGEWASYIKNVNCITDIRSDKEIVKVGFNKIFYAFSENDSIVKKIAEYNKFIKFYEFGGTSSLLALTAAVKLGFSKTILAGIDLAFKDNIMYASGEVVNRISQEEVLADSVKKNVVKIKSVTGDDVYTRDDYASYVEHFNTLIKDMGSPEIYNVSSFGAMLNGVKNTSFEQLLIIPPAFKISVEDVEPFKFDVKSFMQEEFFNINSIISLLAKDSFTPELVSAIVKSVFVYQYMQANIVTSLQLQMTPELAAEFISNTKSAIKAVVDLLQTNNFI